MHKNKYLNLQPLPSIIAHEAKTYNKYYFIIAKYKLLYFLHRYLKR